MVLGKWSGPTGWTQSIRTAVLCTAIVLTGLLPAPSEASGPSVQLSPGVERLDLVRHIEYLEDPSGAMSLDAVMAPESAHRYRPAPQKLGEINFGLSSSAYWLRFEVRATSDSTWLLETRYPHIDRLELYVTAADAVFAAHVLGDTLPFAERSFAHRNLVAPLDFRSGSIQMVYMRAASSGPIVLPMMLWEPLAFAQRDEAMFGWLALYLGMLVALSLYNYLLYVSLRERVYLAYATYAASMGIAQAAYAGLAFQYLWPTLPEWTTVAPILLLALAAHWGNTFVRLFLDSQAPFYDRIYRWLVGGLVVGAATTFISYRTGLYIILLTTAVGVIASIIAGLSVARRGLPGARYFVIAWSALGVGVVLFCLGLIELLPASSLAIYAVQAGSAAELLLLALALAERIHVMRREKEAAQEHALESQRMMLDALHKSERELEARIAARTHELALTNSKLRAREQDLEHLVRHDPLTGLANRVLLYDRMTHALSQRARDGAMLAVLIIDLDFFKPVNDQYGHAVGDELLKGIAARFKMCVREGDTVARLGGDEFVVLMESVRDSMAVERVVHSLNEAAAQPFEVNGMQLQIAGSVGSALYPHDGKEVKTLLAAADAAMYRFKQQQKAAMDGIAP